MGQKIGRLFLRLACRTIKGKQRHEADRGPAGVGQLGARGDAGKKLLKPKVRKMAASYAFEGLGLSERRACLLTGVSPSVYRYRPERGDDDALRRRMRELAGERKRLAVPGCTSC